MKSSGFWRSAAVVLLAVAMAGARAEEEGVLSLQSKKSKVEFSDSAATLVVFNRNDPDSAGLALFYAEKRGIPKLQIVGLNCSKAEEISREDYDNTIAEPLRRAFTANFWWKRREPGHLLGPIEASRIRFIALIRGMPLKISAVANYRGDVPSGPAGVAGHNEAAVDSELATLGLCTRSISGVLANPYFRSFSNFRDLPRPELMLVCRLDGPTPEIVRRMITDGLAAEESGLVGMAYVDARGITNGGYVIGDKWLLGLAGEARRRGMPVILDTGPEMFPEGYPMTNAALYFGWYSDHVQGPFTRPGFRFNRGAVAVHIHSFSASSVRDTVTGWVGPLLAAGAAATLGNVYEPFLTLTPQLDVFHDRLRAGFNFAESAYMSQNMLSWMTTFVGDPLYRPFKGAVELDERPKDGEWAEYRAGAVRWASPRERAAAEAGLRAAARKRRSGVIMEGLGLLQLTADDRAGALASFEQARQFYGPGEPGVRTAFHEIVQLRALQREREALALISKLLTGAADAPWAPLLRGMDTEIRTALAPPR